MNPRDIIQSMIGDSSSKKDSATAFAPTNIAVVKYWGKRSSDLNLPYTSSLSLSIDSLGCTTHIRRHDQAQDALFINQRAIQAEKNSYQRMLAFLNLIRPSHDYFYHINSDSQVPIAAGLASSACGFASLVKALNELHHWQLTLPQQSILARLGSGSACRSFWPGFVKWQRGQLQNGLDSHGMPLDLDWPELGFGVLMISDQTKKISSRDAMQITQATSLLYRNWPERVEADLTQILGCIQAQDFHGFGRIIEQNAMAMHACMLAASPSIDYCQPDTLRYRQLITRARADGLPIYFTQDAGPNIKCFFPKSAQKEVLEAFPAIQIHEAWIQESVEAGH